MKSVRVSQAAKVFNIGTGTLLDFLCEHGHLLPKSPNTKLTDEQYAVLEAHYMGTAPPPTTLPPQEEASSAELAEEEALTSAPEEPTPPPAEREVVVAKSGFLRGVRIVGKITLEEAKTPTSIKPTTAASTETARQQGKKAETSGETAEEGHKKKRFRKRIPLQTSGATPGETSVGHPADKRDKESGKSPYRGKVAENIRSTFSALSHSTSGAARTKLRKERKLARRKGVESDKTDSKVLKMAEFSSVNDLASLMGVAANDIITMCMKMGMLVSINQRLDAEIITLIADEYNYEVSFEEEKVLDWEVEEEEVADDEVRSPIVTVMGHVDHGKTSLLDYIRHTKVATLEKGGITQHIGAYEVFNKDKQKVVFLDMPGHAAFTAMRARGASVTDVAIIVVAADDDVRPQTKEAIDHVRLANVPFVVALNKMDKPNANPEKIKESLSKVNVLVEDWGGKYQCQEISAKTGQGVDDLLNKVLLESELLALKAKAGKKGRGMVIEASLDKGRGYLATFLVQNGTLSVGNVVLAGLYYGKVKAMYNDMGEKVITCDPSTPVQVLGLNGAPQAGDKFSVMASDKEARELSDKRRQIQREQSLRTKKHITLDEIGRRLSLGSFKCLNLIIKGDVDGSVEALADALMKLSTEAVEVQVIQRSVGGISESDILLASASDAIIIGFQVRPSLSARKLAEREGIDVRLYSIIFDAINEIEDAIRGMHDKKQQEVVTGSATVKEVFRISKVGNIAGCTVVDGKISRNDSVRIIREGVVVYDSKINQLKREKEGVTEVKSGYECGISIANYEDIKVGDVIEAFTQEEA